MNHVHDQLQTASLRSMFTAFLLAFDVCRLASCLYSLFAIYLYALTVCHFSIDASTIILFVDDPFFTFAKVDGEHLAASAPAIRTDEFMAIFLIVYHKR